MNEQKTVLVTWGSKRGGTEGIARILGEELEREGARVVLAPASSAKTKGVDAVIVGGALYANRWHGHARSFVNREEKRLRELPVWFFSSGPLDDSAEHRTIDPTPRLRVLMERVGAQGHVTFGGRLAPDAQGFPASAMAKKHAGDWRNAEGIRAWGTEITRALPTARPGVAKTPPGRSLGRLGLHALVGWAACAATMGALLSVTSLGVALVVHAIVAPIVFAAVSRHYFLDDGARDPVPTALAFVGIVGLLDLVVVAGLIERSLAMFGSVSGTWLPLGLIFLTTWAIGEMLSTMPWPKGPDGKKGDVVDAGSLEPRKV